MQRNTRSHVPTVEATRPLLAPVRSVRRCSRGGSCCCRAASSCALATSICCTNIRSLAGACLRHTRYTLHVDAHTQHARARLH